MNNFPTQRQEEVLRDVARFPGESLASRSERMGCTRSGVLEFLEALERKRLAVRTSGGRWSCTAAGKRWLE